MKNLANVGIVTFTAILFLINSMVVLAADMGSNLDPSIVDISYNSSNPDFNDIIHPHSTIITGSGIATPKIGEIRIVDPGNASDIQAKIDSCPRNGCRIYVPPGVYNITQTIVIMDNVSNPAHNHIILMGAASGSPNNEGGTIFVHGADNINIINVTGKVNNSDAGGWEMIYNIKIENIYFKSDFSKRGYAIYIRDDGNRGVKIINNYFSNFYDPAIALTNTWGLHADHNTFYRCGNTADSTYCIEYLTPGWTNNNYVTIVNNLFFLNDSNRGAINTYETTDSYIANNYIEGGQNPIWTNYDSRVIGNYLYYFKNGNGIYSGAGGIIAKGNHIIMDPASSSGVGIASYSSVFMDNVVVNTGIGAGSYFSSVAVGNLVIGGTISVGDTSQYSVISNNVVKNCPAGSAGISVGSNSHIITGNSINNCTYGIQESVSGDGNNTITDNVVLGNTNPVSTTGTNTKVYKNMGYTTENKNTTSVVNGDYVAHGLATIPSYVDLSPDAYNMTAYLMSKNSTHIQIGLYYTTTGTNVTSSTNVSWYAEV
jgi:hypothetical protein